MIKETGDEKMVSDDLRDDPMGRDLRKAARQVKYAGSQAKEKIAKLRT